MAGSSCKGDNEITEVAETSSPFDIGSNVNPQAIETTTNRVGVGGFELKECDNIVEHGCMREISKPTPSASKCICEGLKEAANDSPWYGALARGNCTILMILLKKNPCLVAETGPEGRTILHVAAQRGCVELINQIYDLFNGENKFVDEKFGVKVDLFELAKAKYGNFQAEAKDIAWFTCPHEVLEFLINIGFCNIGGSISLTQGSNSDASLHLRNKLIGIMQGETAKKAFKTLGRFYVSDVNYNFISPDGGLLFHFACYCLKLDDAKNYFKIVICGCLDLGPFESFEVLTYLFRLHNAHGQTPIHVALSNRYIPEFLALLHEFDVDYKECLNARDVKGWTALHMAAATKKHNDLYVLLKEERIDVNAKIEFRPKRYMDFLPRFTVAVECQLKNKCQLKDIGITALHLAILHNDVKSVELLLKCPHINVNALFKRDIVCGYEMIKSHDNETENFERRLYWSPLQLASIMGLSDIVRALLVHKVDDIHDIGKFQNNTIVGKKFQRISAIHFACASGKPDTLRLFLDNQMFNPLVKSKEGATTLHYAANAMTPTLQVNSRDLKVDRYLYFSNLAYLDIARKRYKEETRNTQYAYKSYLGRQACITMLLQAGVDIWEKDNQGRLAEPGPQAPEEAHLWWHEKMAQEILEAKKSLNDAANAISVVAALVATASFVGPLQPPLGYGGDSMDGRVQDTYLSIRVFMVSNNLSFYFAVASILFAVVPSLPMPQEGIYMEWQRTRRTIGVAIFFLLMSVLGVLISFGVASNLVVSEGYSWQRDGLLFYPSLLGGLICILGIGSLFLRLLRLIFNKNEKIRYLYKFFVKL